MIGSRDMRHQELRVVWNLYLLRQQQGRRYRVTRQRETPYLQKVLFLPVTAVRFRLFTNGIFPSLQTRVEIPPEASYKTKVDGAVRIDSFKAT